MSGYITILKYKNEDVKNNIMKFFNNEYEFSEVTPQELRLNARLSKNDIQEMSNSVSPSSYIIKFYQDNKLDCYASDGVLKYSMEYMTRNNSDPEEFPIETCVGSFNFLNTYLDEFYEKFLNKHRKVITSGTKTYISEYFDVVLEKLNDEVNNMLTLDSYDFVCSCEQIM